LNNLNLMSLERRETGRGIASYTLLLVVTQ
jgi:hypothetical protein